ncbi:UNVERIFIED_CONTAM: hypothetical protein Sangu_2884600 [Sesamum angustifolium]|uniref:RNase H type-1 domain-containing protein n=1 Tax=Sesamum angustifolium TaxID=2727405 RepID=A0AAW2IN59_9LAMI
MFHEQWKGDQSIAQMVGFIFQPPTARLLKMVRWIPPLQGRWKLNFEGASKGNPSPVGAGGLVRDSHGRMLFGFYDFLDEHSNTYAELFAVVRGLQYVQDFGLSSYYSGA